MPIPRFPLASSRRHRVFAARPAEIPLSGIHVSPMSPIAHRIVVASNPAGFIPGRSLRLPARLFGSAKPQPVLA
jgi:hypothetical protein